MQTDFSGHKKARRRFFIESVGLILIVLTPFLFKMHNYLPTEKEATITFLGITFDNHGFNNLSTYAWFLLNKLIPLYLLIIWFFTCKHWWYHILLIPLCMYAFQIFEVIYSSDDTIESENVLWLLPICMVVIPFVYFIRVKLYDKYVHGIDLEAMEAELQAYKDKNNKKSLSQLPENEGDLVNPDLDLSERVPKKTLSNLIRQFQLSLKNLFNFM